MAQVEDLLAGSEVRAEPAAGTRELARLAEAVRPAESELDAFMLDLAKPERYGTRYETYLDARLRVLEEAGAAYQAAASQA